MGKKNGFCHQARSLVNASRRKQSSRCLSGRLTLSLISANSVARREDTTPTSALHLKHAKRIARRGGIAIDFHLCGLT